MTPRSLLHLAAAMALLAGIAYAAPLAARVGPAPAARTSTPPAAATPDVGPRVPDVPVPAPTVVAHYADGTVAVLEGRLVDRVQSYDEWKAAAGPPPVLTGSDLGLLWSGLAARGWPGDEADRLAWALITCEAPLYERRMTADGWRTTGAIIGIDLQARGDGGLAHGGGAVRVDVWPDLAARYNLDTLDGMLDAVTAIRAASIRYGRPALEPWSCVGRRCAHRRGRCCTGHGCSGAPSLACGRLLRTGNREG